MERQYTQPLEANPSFPQRRTPCNPDPKGPEICFQNTLLSLWYSRLSAEKEKTTS